MNIIKVGNILPLHAFGTTKLESSSSTHLTSVSYIQLFEASWNSATAQGEGLVVVPSKHFPIGNI